MLRVPYPVVLVCGGRDFTDYGLLQDTLNNFSKIEVIIHGDCKGADWLAKKYALRHGIHYAMVPALWGHHGPAAGPIRNKAMTLLRPELCVAFAGGKDTSSMVQLCRENDIIVYDVQKDIFC